MRTIAVMLIAAVAAAGSFGQQLVAVQRVYSDEITNLAWSIDKVFVRPDGSLYDPTGTFAKYGDVEYLRRVNQGMSEILDAGSNAFKKAEKEFLDAMASNPPPKVVHVKMISAPHTSADPNGRVPYGLLVKEDGTSENWYLSSPFVLKPTIVRRMRCLSQDGTRWTTNYEACTWIDYHGDRTNANPIAVGDYPRTIRMTDPPIPAGVSKVIRDSHLHWGHPENGMEWGSMSVATVDGDGNVIYALTGLHTARVDSVTFEFKLKNGATQEVKEVE